MSNRSDIKKKRVHIKREKGLNSDPSKSSGHNPNSYPKHVLDFKKFV